MRQVLLVGGNAKQNKAIIGPRLQSCGLNPISLPSKKGLDRSSRINIPTGVVAVLALTDLMSHSAYYAFKTEADRRGIPFIGITRHWSKSSQILKQQGLISEAPAESQQEPVVEVKFKITPISETKGMTLSDIKQKRPHLYTDISEDRTKVMRELLRRSNQYHGDMRLLSDRMKELGYGGADPITFRRIKVELGLDVGDSPDEKVRKQKARDEAARRILRDGGPRNIHALNALLKSQGYMGINGPAFSDLIKEIDGGPEWSDEPVTKAPPTRQAPLQAPVPARVEIVQTPQPSDKQRLSDLLAELKGLMLKTGVRSILMLDNGKVDIVREEIKVTEVSESIEV